MANPPFLRIGDGNVAGHLDATGEAGREPRLFGTSLVVAGSATARSEVTVDGLIVGEPLTTPTGFVFVRFESNYTLRRFDRLLAPNRPGFGTIARFAHCDTSVFEDTDWEGHLYDKPHTDATIAMVGCSGSAPLLHVHGSGELFGVGLVQGGAGILDMVGGAAFVCTWTGAVSRDWREPGNWSGCANGRGGFPDVNDDAIVPGGLPNEPQIAGRLLVGRLNPGFPASTGTITIGAGTTVEALRVDTIAGRITLAGDSPSCTTCAYAGRIDTPVTPGTLVLAPGVQVTNRVLLYKGGAIATAGSGADPSTWPLIRNMVLSDGTLDVDGLRLSTGCGSYPALSLQSTPIFTRFSRVQFETTATPCAAPYISSSSCPTTYAGAPWEQIGFAQALAAGTVYAKLDAGCKLPTGAIDFRLAPTAKVPSLDQATLEPRGVLKLAP
jgi:hypothetical protein